MTKDQYIIELKAELRLHMDWARDLSDEYLDGDPDVRKAFVEDRERASHLLTVVPEG